VPNFEVPQRLRPAHGFIRRCYDRMLEVDGMDRAIAIGALSFTAIFPLLIVYASLLTRDDGNEISDRLIDRLDLSGDAADSLATAFAPPLGSNTATVIGFLLVIVTALSFTRAVQRLYERCWGLDRRGMRASGWGLLWLGLLLVYIGIQPSLDLSLPRGIHLPVSLAAASLLWLCTPYLLLGRRVSYRVLAPGAVLTALVLTFFGVGSAIVMPELVASSAEQFGTIGVAFALLSWLTGVSITIMGCAVVGAEIAGVRTESKDADDD